MGIPILIRKQHRESSLRKELFKGWISHDLAKMTTIYCKIVTPIALAHTSIMSHNYRFLGL